MVDKIKILITDAVDAQCIDILTSEGLEVEYRPGMDREDIIKAIVSADALIVRSQTKVDTTLLQAGVRLKIVGRAGAGVDNIDVETATRRGIIVMNTPGGNTIATAEHTISLMLSLARNIPQADQSMKEGKWERALFIGTELHGKILGIIGLGKVGTEVAKRCLAFGMRILAYDPAQLKEYILRLGAEPVTFQELLLASDFISVHAPLIDETRGLLSRDSFLKCKTGVRIINCARGGIVNEQDLLDAIESGKVAGAALDVFEHEPPKNSPLIRHPRVVLTPHLGASTEEAQEKVAIQIANQVVEALRGDSVTGSVNADLLRIAMTKELQPYMVLAESIGKFISQIKDGALTSVCITQTTEVPGEALPALGAAVIKGLFANIMSEPVNYLNAHLIARDRGIMMQLRQEIVNERFVHLVEVEYSTEKERRIVGGTVSGANDIRLTRIDQFHFELKPEGHLLIYTNPDRPGMLAQVSRKLADADINIAGLSLGRYGKGEKALTIISIDNPVDSKTLHGITMLEGVHDLKVVDL
jgi:D-3-phosphoglycerate dehydrogenase